MAVNEDDWLRLLEQLLADDVYQNVTDNLRVRTLQLADVDKRATDFLNDVAARALI